METFHNIPSQNTLYVKINVVLTASHCFFRSEIEVTELYLANALRVRLHSHQSINMFKRYVYFNTAELNFFFIKAAYCIFFDCKFGGTW